MSLLASRIGGRIFELIQGHARQAAIGRAFPGDRGYRCFNCHPNAVLKPTVSLIRSDRFLIGHLSQGDLRTVPDLVVMVHSPKDLAETAEGKVDLFHRAGVPLIWIVSPKVRVVRTLRADRTGWYLRDGDSLSGEDVIPGFACPVSSIFPTRPAEPVAEVAPMA